MEKNVTKKLKVVKDNLANAPADIKSKMDGIKLAANYSAVSLHTHYKENKSYRGLRAKKV